MHVVVQQANQGAARLQISGLDTDGLPIGHASVLLHDGVDGSVPGVAAGAEVSRHADETALRIKTRTGAVDRRAGHCIEAELGTDLPAAQQPIKGAKHAGHATRLPTRLCAPAQLAITQFGIRRGQADLVPGPVGGEVLEIAQARARGEVIALAAAARDHVDVADHCVLADEIARSRQRLDLGIVTTIGLRTGAVEAPCAVFLCTTATAPPTWHAGQTQGLEPLPHAVPGLASGVAAQVLLVFGLGMGQLALAFARQAQQLLRVHAAQVIRAEQHLRQQRNGLVIALGRQAFARLLQQQVECRVSAHFAGAGQRRTSASRRRHGLSGRFGRLFVVDAQPGAAVDLARLAQQPFGLLAREERTSPQPVPGLAIHLDVRHVDGRFEQLARARDVRVGERGLRGIQVDGIAADGPRRVVHRQRRASLLCADHADAQATHTRSRRQHVLLDPVPRHDELCPASQAR